MASVALDDVIQAFNKWRIKIQDNKELIGKCADLCRSLRINADQLATEWQAFSMNNSGGSSSNLEMTVSHLERLGTKLTNKYEKSASSSSGNNTKSGLTATIRRGAPISHSLITNKTPLPGSIDRLSQNFSSPVSPMVPNLSASHNTSPSNIQPKKIQRTSIDGNNIDGKEMNFSSSNDSEIKNEEESSQFNGHLNHNSSSGTSSNIIKNDLSLTSPRCLIDLYGFNNILNNVKYMHFTLEDRGDHMRNQIVSFCHTLNDERGIPALAVGEPPKLTAVGTPYQGTIIVCGRICCDSPTGRINSKSCILEGANGNRVKLEFTETNGTEYSLFPGQLVLVQGVCAGGRTLAVERLHKFPIPSSPLSRASDILSRYNTTQGHSPLSIMVASGPFTSGDDLSLDGLETFMAKVEKNNPDVLILLGPFVDARHPMISSGKPYFDIESDEYEEEESNNNNNKKSNLKRKKKMERVYLTFEELFTLVCYKISPVLTNCPKTQVIMVPSIHDATHSHVVFPQPPLVLPENSFNKEIMKRVKLVSNPATFSINETVIGVSTADVIANLVSEDVRSVNVAAAQSSRKNGRFLGLAEHLVLQRSFYPLFPPAEGSPVDYMQSSKFEMPEKVDILICPSKLAPFVGEVAIPGLMNVPIMLQNQSNQGTGSGTLCLNPGSIGFGKRTFANLYIHPLEAAMLKSAGDNLIPHDVSKRTRVTHEEVGSST